jgi:uncharacterized protein YbjT (DUF2867 family)
MADKPIVLVTGATGAQGGGVARHLLAGGRFAVRCLTRNPTSDRAAALKRAGAEVVAGDLDDPASLRAALDGCHAAFGVTNFWEHFDDEERQGRNLIDALAAANLRHVVLSTLPSPKEITRGRLVVPHFDIKARLEAYARGLKLPATFVHVAFYYDNFLSFFPPRRQDDGVHAFGFPQGDTPLAAVAAEDIGGVVAALFGRPDDFVGRTVGVVGDDRPPAAYAGIMARVLGERIEYRYVPREAFAALGFPGAEDLANMFEFNRLHVPSRRGDLEESRRLYPEIQTFEAWVRANADRLRAALAA